jgi:acyl-CoA synthetase (AMP-forming)/AMP-acid ligase II
VTQPPILLTMPRPAIKSLVAVLLVSAALRFAVIPLTDPVMKFDSPGYTQLASAIRHLDLSDDKGERVPIYPLFLIVFGNRPAYAALGQALVGLLSTAGLFLLAWKLTRNEKWAALGAAFYVQGPAGVAASDVRRHLARRMPPWCQPRVVQVTQELPRLPGGKTDRMACAAILDGLRQGQTAREERSR